MVPDSRKAQVAKLPGVPGAVWVLGLVSLFMDLSSEMIHALLPVYLVTVLGEIPDRAAGLREIFAALKPGGILSVTEIIFDPHFQSRQAVARLARSAGFNEKAFHGNRIAFTLNLEKPRDLTTQST
jgi:predicted methyltransferase